jgi:hypothetical protein
MRQGILGHLGRLVAMLEAGAGGAAAQETPFGLLAPPLGPARLKAVEVVAALLRLGSPSAEQGAPRPRPLRGRCAAAVLLLLIFLFLWVGGNREADHRGLGHLVCKRMQRGGAMQTHMRCTWVSRVRNNAVTTQALQRGATAAARAGVRDAGAAVKCLQLFLRFPFNNLLHHQARAWPPLAGQQAPRARPSSLPGRQPPARPC